MTDVSSDILTKRAGAAIRLARQELQDKGWIQNESSNENGRCCDAAIWCASVDLFKDKIGEIGPLNPDFVRVYHHARSLVEKIINKEQVQFPPSNIIFWNDKKGRKFKEVKSLLSEAIQTYDPAGGPGGPGGPV